ncbi:hypothetical protein [Chromobacterium piscinae]|uniref:hypothetical protein n=1 Tax=Chromobacterium piscinae TaxID=686831 RepID=UPI0014084D51|nr:hypothetical protein [Chromobacterium piscinae]MBX9297885.1 hypothetical protein [Chromobacterium vaccinii]MBX9355745.1 hypothetical protein [Chromobacterium vaccinii]MCD4504302.1 hypothetical protein [Chromobacterium piscinae]NHQ81439.1 hypothetical protein [Chromobacterium vaccinii]
MKKTILTCMLAWCGLASAASPEAPPLSGHYYLQDVREVGAELLLKPDGSFEWGMSYGAVDQYAQGNWKAQGGKVELHSAAPEKAPVFRPFRDEEFRIRRPAEEGSWLAIVGMPGVGPMAGVEVSFQSRSGKVLVAVTDRNGDAMVSSPKGEAWSKAGLRRNGGKDQPQWFDVPEERSAQRLAAFAVDDAAYLRQPPFQNLILTVRKDGKLEVDDGAGRMVYARQDAGKEE